MNSRLISLAGALALLATPSVVAQENGKITEGRLDAIGADGKPLGPINQLQAMMADTALTPAQKIKKIGQR